MKRISVVVPVFNEQDCIVEMYKRTSQVFKDSLPHYSWELLFVNDGSHDATAETINKIVASDPQVGVIHFTRNFGQHPALCAGIRHASGDYVVLIDGDLQNPPEEIPKLIAKIEQGYDVVYGAREKRKDNILRRMGSWFVHKLLHIILGMGSFDSATSFRVLSKKVVKEFISLPQHIRYPIVVITWLGFKSASVKTAHDARHAGVSKYSYWRFIKMTAQLAMDFSPHLLRMITMLGFVVSSLSFLIGSYFTYIRFVSKIHVPGFTALVVLITFFFGVTFIVLGILSEYIAKIFQSTLARPYYVIDEYICKSKEEQLSHSLFPSKKSEPLKEKSSI